MSVQTEIVDEVTDDQFVDTENDGGETLPEPAHTNDGAAGATEDPGLVYSFGEELPVDDDATAPQWVKDVRKQNRELQRENRELKAKQVSPATQAADPGPKPKLDDPDIDFDAELFEQRLDAWKDKQRAIVAQQEAAQAAIKAEQEAWQARIAQHQQGKSKLAVSDYDDAEEALLSILSETQIGILVAGAEDSAKLAYALGKNPAKAKELAAIKDPVKFAFATAKLETQMKAIPRKTAPPPDKVVRGNVGASAAGDKELERLEAEAQRTGDRTNIVRYRAQQRALKSA